MIKLKDLLPLKESAKVLLRVPNDVKKIYKLFKKNKKQNSLDEIFFKDLEEKFSELPYLSNDTKDIIDFDNTVNNIDNKKKKRKFWELLK